MVPSLFLSAIGRIIAAPELRPGSTAANESWAFECSQQSIVKVFAFSGYLLIESIKQNATLLMNHAI